MPWIVNGEKIDDILIKREAEQMRPEYQKVFTEQSTEEQEKQLLEWAKENVIERTLLKQAAQNDEEAVPEKNIEDAYQQLIKMHKNEAKFLQHAGISKRDIPKVKKELELKYRIDRLIERITSKIPQFDQKTLLDYYTKNKKKYTVPEQVRAAHIVVHTSAQVPPNKAREAIVNIQKELDNAESFEEVADKYGDCPGNGGDLGYFPRGQMVQSFEDVVFNMTPGEISDVFQTEFGFHIVKLHDKQPQRVLSPEEVADEIRKELAEEHKNTLLEGYLDRLRAEAEIISFESSPGGQNPFNIVDTSNLSQRTDRKNKKPLSSVLVKPSGPDCNLDCTYCFYLEKADLFPETKTHRMSEETLEIMISQIMEDGEKYISFGWQGGEPTLMGLDFFKKAVHFQQHFGQEQTVGNGLQTNGTLLNSEWAKFLAEYNFLVGLSLDGPEHIHDHYRLMKGGQKSWKKVHDKARLLQDAGVEVNALTVVNDYSVQFPEEIYHYHKSLGLTYQQYIPCVETDPAHPDIAAPFSVTPEQYGQFLCKIFDLWKADFKDGKPTTSVRHFDSVFHSYVGLNPPECTLMQECGIYVVVEHNGDVYSCDFFVEPEWKLGNIRDGRIYDFLNSDRQKEFGKVKTRLPEKCSSCRWLDYCWGGCPKDRLRDPRDKNLSHFCESYIQFFEHADKDLQSMANAWKRQFQQDNQGINQSKNPATLAKVGRNDPCPCGSGKKYKKCCQNL